MWTPGATGFDADSTRSLWSSLPRKTDDRGALAAPAPPAVTCTVRGGVVFVDECGDGFRARDAAGEPDHTEGIQAALNATAHTVVLRNLSAATPWIARPLFLYNNDRLDPTACSRFSLFSLNCVFTPTALHLQRAPLRGECLPARQARPGMQAGGAGHVLSRP